MPKYLSIASYTAEGAKGLLKEGGSARRAAVEKLVESAGGRLEACYFAFGENDLYSLMDLPDHASAAAAALAAGAPGSRPLCS